MIPNEICKQCNNDFESNEHDPMITNFLFNDFESKPIVLIDVPFCNENEKVSKTFEGFHQRSVWFQNYLENKQSQTACPFD